MSSVIDTARASVDLAKVYAHYWEERVWEDHGDCVENALIVIDEIDAAREFLLDAKRAFIRRLHSTPDGGPILRQLDREAAARRAQRGGQR